MFVTITLSVVLTNSDSNYEGINVLISSATAVQKTGQVVHGQKDIYASAGHGGASDWFEGHPSPVLHYSVFESKDDGLWLDELLFFPAFGTPQELASPILLNFGPRDVRPQEMVPQDGDVPLYRGTKVGEILVAKRNESMSEHPR